MTEAILGFFWTILKGMAFLGGIMVFFAFLGSFYKTIRKMAGQRKEFEKRMEKAWDGDGGKKDKGGKNGRV